MFKSARLKLTGWYLLIIMLISIAFSLVIYTAISRELEHGFRRVEMRFRARELNIPLPQHFSTRPEDLPPRLRELPPRFFLVEDIQAAKKRLGLNLLMINGFILGISAVAGYLLAGKTLKPIEAVLEEQKRFVTDASHELRTPLTALKTSLEVALRDKKLTTKEARATLESSLEDINRLQSLTNNLLGLSHYQEGATKLSFKKVGLAAVIESACEKIRPLAKKKGVAVEFEAADLTIEADKESLEEMMVIFLDNGVKFTPQGGKVTVVAKPEKKYALIGVGDTGVGIAKEDLPHIFDRFYRADKSHSKTEVDGFGLGLALAKKIIEMHRGSVAVSSVLDKGTTFTIKLPL